MDTLTNENIADHVDGQYRMNRIKVLKNKFTFTQDSSMGNENYNALSSTRLAAYAASKHALHGFFESLRSETVEQGILITMIISGMIKTAITAHAVTGTGGIVGRIDKTFETAYPVEKAAQKIIRGILKEKEEEAIVGGMEVITLWLNRVSPWLLRRVIRNHPIKWMRQLKERFLFGKK